MAFTSSDLTAVESAIATGEMTVEVDGRRITYRSIDDLRKARTMITAALQSSGVSVAVPRTSYTVRSRN